LECESLEIPNPFEKVLTTSRKVSPVGETTFLDVSNTKRGVGRETLSNPNINVGVTVKFGGNFVVKVCCRIRLQKGGGYINPRFIQFITD